MISLHSIEKALEHSELDRLVADLAPGGAELPLPLRVALASSPAAPLALALRRTVQLTYGPTPLSRDLLARLLDVLHAPGPDATGTGASGGGGGGGGGGDLLGLAATAAALGTLLAEHPDGEATPAVRAAYDRALGALAAAQAGDGLFVGAAERTFTERVRHSAAALMLLGDQPAFRAAVRYAELVSWFDEHADRLDPTAERFWTIARAGDQARHAAEAAVGFQLAA